MQKMELEQLERLRHANQDLLERLKVKQEEIKKRLPRKPLSSSSLSRRTTPAERAVPVPKRGKENQVRATKGTTDPVTLVSVEPGASAARAALHSPLKPAACGREGRGVLHRRAGAHPGSPRAERSFTPAASITRETSRVARDGNALRNPGEESTPVKHRESRKQSTMLRGTPERGRPRAEAETVLGRTPAEGNGWQRTAIRDSRTPKSILLTPGGKEVKKEAGRVTFLSDPEEYTIPADSWSARPFLGYDWIAGLLETDSSLSEKSEQYFSELREFRQVNKEACVHEEDLGVSIPRSTLLPAYKYKIHRRKSFEPADDLALPSHCLAGWENVVPSSSPTLSSLDLRTSLQQKPTDHSHLTLVSRMSGGTRTDQLLNLSRSAHFRLSNASQQRAPDKPLCYRATPN
ncbi:migration and invasion-inhibitory protein isoform X2 [Terrapene carolina triunguis]|uniref:migration and invasion-inhibitory protein isoform X2 n=1 Tax=Terrapene triunguis TaxID=2587831 RepID=UPI001156BEE0|nr:migration and invasion-inhibitory protein isoform X2 [Terrapene carolina triunguis]